LFRRRVTENCTRNAPPTRRIIYKRRITNKDIIIAVENTTENAHRPRQASLLYSLPFLFFLFFSVSPVYRDSSNPKEEKLTFFSSPPPHRALETRWQAINYTVRNVLKTDATFTHRCRATWAERGGAIVNFDNELKERNG